MLIMPCAHDQPDNAARADRLGVARIIPRRHCASARLAAEITALLSNPEYEARAAEVARLVRGENGTLAACLAMEACLASPGSGMSSQTQPTCYSGTAGLRANP
jgi:UDP:flavonoid glycosyltransferase YjiC (YdhE family)